MEITKTCPCCRETKSINLFYKSAMSPAAIEYKKAQDPDYIQPRERICKSCANAVVRKEREIKRWVPRQDISQEQINLYGDPQDYWYFKECEEEEALEKEGKL